MSDGPLIAIVGRPNVGKSSLYNRLVGGRPALVHDTPGLTRDRRYGSFERGQRRYRVVDTGGLDPEVENDVIGSGIHRQAWRAIEESDVVVFLVDAAAGLLPLDRELSRLLRRSGKPIVCAANKVDNPKRQVLINDMFALGLGEVYGISAAHGLGIDELLTAIVEAIPRTQVQPRNVDVDVDVEVDGDVDDNVEVDGDSDGDVRVDGDAPVDSDADHTADAESDADAESLDGDGHLIDDDSPDDDANAGPGRRRTRRDRPLSDPIRVAFIGKPNAGKSSLVNRLLGFERSLVHHEPGTTTDPVDTPLSLGGRAYVLVDTAGMRRRSRVEDEVEKIAISLARDQVRSADVVVLVVDGSTGTTDQDARLAGLIEESGAAVVVALNKSDLLSASGGGALAGRAARDHAKDVLHFLPFAPVVLISALRGDGVDKLMDTVAAVAAQHRRRITTSQLNNFFAEVAEVQPPPLHRGVPVRIHYLTQAATSPPTFLLFANRVEGVSAQYRRFLANRLRERYGFKGTPLRIFVKAKVKTPSLR